MEYIDMYMLSYHIDDVANGRSEEDGPPDFEHLETYTDLIEELRLGLNEWCDQGPFKKGLHYLLATPDIDLEWYCESQWGYLEDEARALLEFIWRSLYPNESVPTEPLEGVKLVALGHMPQDWWIARGIIYHAKPGDTFRSIAQKFGYTLEHLQALNTFNASQYGPSELEYEVPANLFRLRDIGECYEQDQYGLSEEAVEQYLASKRK